MDLGFAFLPQFRGKGYAYEAAAATLNHGRSALGLSRVVALVSPENRDSLHLLARLGLEFERMVMPPTEALEVCLMATSPGTQRADAASTALPRTRPA